MAYKHKHTPTPWVCHSGSVYQDGPGVWPNGELEGVPIAKMNRNTEHTAPTERDANAHFIVEAANAYDRLRRDNAAMLKALRGLVESPRKIEDHNPPLDPKWRRVWFEARAKAFVAARAAIRQATSGD